MNDFDIVVIGAGPGGYPAAIRAAQLGASVAVVEKEQLGGTCLNWGCIPTKALIAAADTFVKIKHAEAFGITVKGATVDYAAMIGHKNKVVGQLRGGIGSLLAGNGVKTFTGTASFVDRNTVEIVPVAQASLPASGKTTTTGTEACATRITTKKFIIATGSTSAMPGFLPKHERVVESRGFLDIDKLPASLIVLGGGLVEAMPKEYVKTAEKSMRQHCMRHVVREVRVATAQLKDEAVVMGAARLCREAMGHEHQKSK